MFQLDNIALRHKTPRQKARFAEIERLLCDYRPDLTKRCRRPWMKRKKPTARLTKEEKEEAARIRAERKYAAQKMGGIGRGAFRKAGSDKHSQKEWRIWWRAKNRRSANMVNAASEIWLMERGLQNWRHTRGAARFNSY